MTRWSSQRQGLQHGARAAEGGMSGGTERPRPAPEQREAGDDRPADPVREKVAAHLTGKDRARRIAPGSLFASARVARLADVALDRGHRRSSRRILPRWRLPSAETISAACTGDDRAGSHFSKVMGAFAIGCRCVEAQPSAPPLRPRASLVRAGPESPVPRGTAQAAPSRYIGRVRGLMEPARG